MEQLHLILTQFVTARKVVNTSIMYNNFVNFNLCNYKHHKGNRDTSDKPIHHNTNKHYKLLTMLTHVVYLFKNLLLKVEGSSISCVISVSNFLSVCVCV